MAVRDFDGTDDRVTHASGGLSGMTHGTVAVLFKLDAVGAFQAIFHLHDSGGTFLAGMPYVDNSNNLNTFSGSDSSSGITLTSGIWYLVVVRKATGTAAPRFSRYSFTAGTWSHANGANALANWTAPGASGTIRNSFQDSSDFFNGKVAARAAWSNTLPWAASGAGDTAVEAAGLETALQNWADENPDALWPYNQDPLAAIDDVIGAADQTSVTGTTVVTGEDPGGFDFTLGGGGTVAVWSHDVAIT